MSGLKLSFLISDYGPQVIAQLQREASYRAAFSVKAAGVIERYSKDTHTTPQNIKMVMEEFIALTLPERKGAIAKWVFDAYLNGTHNGKQILAEDLYKIKEDLQYFDALKKSCAFREETDLLKYNGLKSLRDTLVPYERVKRLKDAQRAERSISDEVKADILSETTVLYDGLEGRVVMPHTIKASKYWGNNTKWCISGETTADHYFDSHNQKSPVLMVIPKGGEDDKLAIVANTFWNAADDQLNNIPEKHQTIITAMLAGCSEDLHAVIEPLLNKKKQEKYTPQPDTCPSLDNYPEEWKDALKDLHKGTIYLENEEYKDLLADPDFIMAALQQNAFSLSYAAARLRADRDIVMAAVKKNGWSLQFASPKWRADRDIVLTAVQNAGSALKHAGPDLQDDFDIVLAAVQNDGKAIQFAPFDRRSNYDLGLAAVQQNPTAIMAIHWSLKTEPEIVHAAIEKSGWLIEYVQPEQRKNAEFIGGCLEKYPELNFDNEFWSNQRAYSCNTVFILQKQKAAFKSFMQDDNDEKCRKYARFMPECWGDAEMVFGTNPDKIRAALKTSPHRASLRRKPEPGVL